VQFFDSAGTQGFLGRYDDRFAVLSFRGTERDFTDIQTDINIFQESLPDEAFLAHAGFLRSLRQVWGTAMGFTPVAGFQAKWVAAGAEGVSNTLESLPNEMPTYFTGHSLGAALATLAAYKALRLKRGPCALYTFGSPRVASKELASLINNQLQGQIHRVVNYRDVVPRVPWPWPGHFRHVGNLVYFQRNKQQGGRAINDALVLILAACDIVLHKALRSSYTPEAFTDHRIDEYIDRLS